MKNTGIVYLLILLIVSACKTKNAPDVSHIKIELQVQRFEQDLFNIDTTNIDASLDQLNQKYPGFLQDYVFNILGLSPEADQAVIANQVNAFIRSYKPLKDSADDVFSKMNTITAELEEGLRYVKYYFPSYPVPNKLITFIGPINSYGNILTGNNELAVGLQMYMGSNYSLYQSEAGQQLYPSYISRRFQPAYIPVTCIRNVVDDLYPDRSASRPLVEQMIEAGKRTYLLDHLLPNTEDTLFTGYTAAQLEGAYDNEATIWSFFINNELLFSIDPAITKDYMNESPNTPALGPQSPGFIGQFVGWQIVKKWMEKNEGFSLQKLMETDPKLIFEQAKYKPK
ncbi:hypothetical protein [Aridibaculum aurantiacum]|uniref:gliding motility lipoprotein GldB n=1 Tax=Aridibaculum aurantiacum TaxID=2810307 RepID=UPI001F6049C0|nr:hypothetical protein [Aridibaculum aurantiacum]